jgi:hypothetical protein
LKIALIAAALLTAAVAAAPAAADPINKNTVAVTLDCPDTSYTGISILQSSALPFQIEGHTFVAVLR